MAKKNTERKKSGSLVGGLILVGLGVLFLLDEMFPEINVGQFWPFALIIPGAFLLWQHNNR